MFIKSSVSIEPAAISRAVLIDRQRHRGMQVCIIKATMACVQAQPGHPLRGQGTIVLASACARAGGGAD